MKLGMRIVASSLVLLVAAGCTSRHLAHRSSPRASTRLVLDDGALVITPAHGAPRTTHASAARILAAQELNTESKALRVTLASVTAHVPRPRGDSGPNSRSVTELHLPLAWVYVGHQSPGPMSCSGGGGFRPTPPPSTIVDPSSDWVVIVDARTGAAYRYSGAGAGFCVRETTPTMLRAYVGYSVPFTDVHLGPLLVRQTVQLPPCGVFVSFGSAHGHGTAISPATATAAVPTGPCTGRSSVRVMTLKGRVHDQPHAPLGIECWGNYDVALGPPTGCVPPG